MEAFEMADLLEQRERSGERYLEFLTVPTMSTGIYALPEGAVDTQQPHTEDEVYYVLKGEGKLRAGDAEHAVRKGSVIYVKAGQEHRFTEITEDLQLLVLFSTGPTDPPGKKRNQR